MVVGKIIFVICLFIYVSFPGVNGRDNENLSVDHGEEGGPVLTRHGGLVPRYPTSLPCTTLRDTSMVDRGSVSVDHPVDPQGRVRPD